MNHYTILTFLLISILSVTNIAKSSENKIFSKDKTLINLRNGKIIPAYFFMKFTSPPHFDISKKINFKTTYPEVYNELLKMGKLISVRGPIIRSMLPGANPPYLSILNNIFGHGKLEHFGIYLKDELNCFESNANYGEDVISSEIAGCSYILDSFNTESYDMEYINVIELKRSVFNNEKISPTIKALMLIHEILHHMITNKRSITEFKDLHMVINPFIKNLYTIFIAYMNQVNAHINNERPSKITKKELTASITFQYSMFKMLNLTSFDKATTKLPTFCISSQGGGIYAPGICNQNTSDSDSPEYSSNYLSMDSAILHIKDSMKNNFLFNSILLLKNYVAEKTLTGNTIFNSKVVTNGIILENSFLNNFSSNLIEYNGSYFDNKIFCNSCALFDSSITNSAINNISMKESHLTNVSIDNSNNFSLTLNNSLITELNRTAGSEKNITLVNNATKNITINNLKLDLYFYGPDTFSISRYSPSTLNFSPDKFYKVTKYSERPSYKINIKSVKLFEKKHLRFGNTIENGNWQ